MVNFWHKKSEAQRKFEFAKKLEQHGWTVELEVKLGNRYRFDIILIKNNEIIHVLEVKRTKCNGEVFLNETLETCVSKQCKNYFQHLSQFSNPPKLWLIKINADWHYNQSIDSWLDQLQ